MTVHVLQKMRELHSRRNDGIHVRLLWSEDDGRVAVAVSDARTGEEFASWRNASSIVVAPVPARSGRGMPRASTRPSRSSTISSQRSASSITWPACACVR
jgi:broad specificity polyphosphatase/5'/3'-nucleotidase SurE